MRTPLEQKDTIRAPFIWYGGKSRVSTEVWQLLGKIDRYIEPFAGSLGVYLSQPDYHNMQSVLNDIDGYIINFWRAVQKDPAGVANNTNILVNEIDKIAINRKLINKKEEIANKMMNDIDYYDAEIASQWLYGVNAWIGRGYTIDDYKQIPQLGNKGSGTHGLSFYDNKHKRIEETIQRLSKLFQKSVITCGNWKRAVSNTVCQNKTTQNSGVFLDPPYKGFEHYYSTEQESVDQVWEEIIEWVHNKPEKTRVVLCGYDGDTTLEELPPGWVEKAYKAKGTNTKNATRERFWVSPNCEQATLF